MIPPEAVHQGLLERAIHQLFPGKHISSNVRKGASVKNPVTGSFLEIDVWVPEVLLCFEFQDTYHYESTWESHTPLENVKHKDKSKMESVQARGETLVVVPCWWDGDIDSLKGSVAFQRPDIFSESQTPISLNAPAYFLKKSETIPGVGELMLASFPSVFHLDADAAEYYDWWMGEKYDGVRCCWQPFHEVLYSRNGIPLLLPPQMNCLFPQMFLDGEIWFGRGFFSEAQRVVYASSVVIEWPVCRIIAFDMPNPAAYNLPFEIRYGSILRSVNSLHPFILVAHRHQVTGMMHVTEHVHRIIDNEGEGVILRMRWSLYRPGRAETLLKLKAARSDREALVVQVDSDKSLQLQLPTGETFVVHKKNVQTDISPSRGDIVSFTFENYRNLMPFNPKVVRIRKDISWREVLQEAAVHVPKSQNLTESTLKIVDTKSKSMSYGKLQKQKSIRLFFEGVAKTNKLDPLSPESWYSISQTQIKSTPGGNSVLLQYNGSYIKALINTFPEVKFDVRKFAFMPSNFWRDVGNRRQFFINMARKLGFDPLVAENWYTISEATILNYKGAPSVEFYYKGSFVKALVHLFPEIGLKETKFVALPYNQWTSVHNRKSLMENLAQSKGFSPYKPEHWYILLKERQLPLKSLAPLLSFYKGSISNALLQLFPNIGLNPSKLQSISSYNWKSAANRRNFFVYFAKEHGFDPLIAHNWYSVSPDMIAASMGASSVLAHYNDNYVEALVHLFPEIGLNPALLSGSNRNHLIKAAHRQKLEKLARQRGFNPLIAANWYSLPRETITSMKGGTSLLFTYGHSVSRALIQLFPEIPWDVAKFRRKRNHWDEAANRREFFVDFAATKGIDPLKAEDWYKISASSILATKGSDAVLKHHSGKFGTALQELFPEIGINMKLFLSPPKKRWRDPALRRKLFLDIAEHKSFNPLEPKNWYPLSHDAIIKFKGARSILWHYGGSLVKALIDLFPDVDFDTRKFVHTPYGFWKMEKNRRDFFLQFAEEECFSPLLASNWYGMVEKISKHKGTNSVLHHHGGSVPNALIQLLPEVQFDQAKFSTPRMDSYWFATQNRRKFFKDFAVSNSFEPLVAANWYSVDRSRVMATPGALSVLGFYKGNLSKALFNLFPEIGIDTKRFRA